ncbi:MAG: toprim domain-containing protein [Oscillospiraceae bacterium]|nr:toprim domain-containing protein [Oscillospiraceae bacterium]
MSKKCIVCEKPSVAKSVAKVLGANSRKDGYYENSEYIVTYCYGHLVGLAEPEEYDEKFAEKPWKVEHLPILPEKYGGWKLSVNKDTKKQFEVLKKLLNSAEVTEIINACDEGREGECIFRYVYTAANCKKPVKRL